MMPGEPPKLPFGHFNQVNFFGRPLSQKYGPIYYIWNCFTPVVILSDAGAIRKFYTDHFSHKRERNFTCLGTVFRDILGHCLATSHGREDVRRCRGPFEKYFTADTVNANLEVIGRECTDFMNTLPVGKSIDLKSSKMETVTLKMIAHIVYGEDVVLKYFDRILELEGMLQNTMGHINIGLTRMPFYSYFPTKANENVQLFNTAWRKFNRFLFKEYEEGRLNSGDGFFFAAMEQLKTYVLDISEEELFHSINEILLLNIDVSFAATSFALADIAEHKAIQEKVRSEVDKALQGREPSTFSDLDKKLPYLEMVLKESARMHPALALSLPEKTVKPVSDFGGYMLRNGTVICVDTYSLNYSETYWDSPNQFNPERFANGSRHVPGSFFRFGLGPRKCLGYRYALAIIRVVTASFLQKYILRLTDAGSTPKVKSTGMVFFTPYISPEIVLHER